MGKIYDALEKFRNERKDSISAPALTKKDWDALMQYDRRTGKLNLYNKHIIKDSATIHRLLANKMILPDGTLTSTTKKRCEKMSHQLRIMLAGQQVEPISKKEVFTEPNRSVTDFEIRESDWNILNSYDRKTGYLLNYNQETGEPAKGSAELLRDHGIIQRLVKNNLIYPDGKLTPAAIKHCDELSNNLKSSEDVDGISDGRVSEESQNKEAAKEKETSPHQPMPSQVPVENKIEDTTTIEAGETTS
ncbi:MAG: hypothetical protein JSW07_03605, partial [bacterium]